MKRVQHLACAAAVCVAAVAIPPPILSQEPSSANEQISVRPDGFGGNGLSRDAAISADGRFVAFVSDATNLVAGDDNGTADVFVRDRLLEATERVPLPPGVAGAASPGISGDGRFVVLAADGPEPDVRGTVTHIYLHDRVTRTTQQISVAPASHLASFAPQISVDGRVIAYMLWTGEGEGETVLDVLVYDRDSGQTAHANTTSDGHVLSTWFDPDYAVALSGDGRIVAFTFGAALVPGASGSQVFVRDMAAGTTTIASTPAGTGTQLGYFFRPAVSADGRFVAFFSQNALLPDDTNGMPDTYLRDLVAQTTERVSLGNAGNQLAQGSNLAEGPAISADGRFVAFASIDAEVVGGDTNQSFDVFVRDRQARTTTRVSVGADGEEANASSSGPALTADGRTIAFTSAATNLSAVKNPTTSSDVYVHAQVGAPVLSAIVPSVRELWPPDGRVVDISLAYTVTADGRQPRCDATVTSNEPEFGKQSRQKSADWQVLSAHTVRLRAARNGSGSGRFYTITVRCEDDAAQTVTGTTVIVVPHDRRR
jgi:Tol biopolymer transport system component